MFRYLLILALLSANATFAQNSFRNIDLDPNGRPFFVKEFNVYNRSEEEILKFGVDFANDHGVPSNPKQIENNRFIFPYTFDYHPGKDHCMYNTRIAADIIIEAKFGRTRVTVTNIKYTTPTACYKNGYLSEILSCTSCVKGEIRDLERWMHGDIEVEFMAEYKKYIEKAVKDRTW